MHTSLMFKGRKDGLELQVLNYQQFDGFLPLVENKLLAMGDFLKQSQVKMQVYLSQDSKTKFTDDDIDKLAALLNQYGLEYINKDFLISTEDTSIKVEPLIKDRALVDKKLGKKTGELNFWLSDESVLEQTNCLVVCKNLRSGQSISYHMGSVVIVGDVNPGAKVSAEGSIIITGSTRGELHAGALGEESAVIIAKKIKGGQLRIGGKIAIASGDEMPSVGKGMERASVDKGSIIIEII